MKVVLKYRKARVVEEILRTVLGEPKPAIPVQSGTSATTPVPNPTPNPGEFPFRRGGGGGGLAALFGQPPPAAPPASGAAAAAAASSSAANKLRAYSIASDEDNNTIIVKGPPDVIATAKKVIADMDKGDVPIIVAPPYMKTYPTVPGTAESLAKSLTEILRPSPNMRIGASAKMRFGFGVLLKIKWKLPNI